MRTTDPASASPATTPSEGPEPLDNSYVLGHHGFIYTSSHLPISTTVRHPAVLLISLDHTPFTLTLPDGSLRQATAVMVPPRVERTLDAHDVRVLSINIMPAHAAYHVFRAAQKSGVMTLDRQAFSHLDAEFEALMQGAASINEAELTFSRAVTEAQRLLPPAPAPDPKALSLIRMLDADPNLGLDELARRLGYSQQVMSRLFSSAVGMSLRDYQNWLKQRRVYDVLYTRRSLTQVAYLAGFADSPQFTRTYQRWYGNTPSAARDPKQVRVFIHGGSNQQPPQPPDDQDAG